jgi:hypothetical protein
VQELMRDIGLIDDDNDLDEAVAGALREIEAVLAETSASRASQKQARKK